MVGAAPQGADGVCVPVCTCVRQRACVRGGWSERSPGSRVGADRGNMVSVEHLTLLHLYFQILLS